MINLYIAILLFATSCLAAFAGYHANNRVTAFMLKLASIIYLGESIWKFVVFFILAFKRLIKICLVTNVPNVIVANIFLLVLTFVCAIICTWHDN